MILTDFLKALGQIGDPRFRRVLFLGIGLTLALLFGAYTLVFGGVQLFFPETITLPLIGEISWADTLVSWASVLLMMVLSVFLMVPVASAFIGIFLETVVDAVEDRHYPHLPEVTPIPIGSAIRDSLNFLGILIAANIVALVLYVILAPLAPFIFWGLNGFLLGREYFQMVAMRRIGRPAAKAAWRRNLIRIWFAGSLMAVPLTVPLLNLVVPILGVATFTHLYHRIAPQGSSG
ncbi:MAG: EI24 domain-containing protein [Rhodobacteraceae bacterium]|nr:EI24 domain-containing protein [Paracoccaceae bacterium]